MPNIAVLAMGASVLSLLYAGFLIYRVLQREKGSDKMVEIASHIEEGAKAYLNRQMLTILVFALLLFFVIGFGLQLNGFFIASGFLVGAFFSALAGYIGMSVSVRANVRTTEAAKHGLAPALRVAYEGGAVTGFAVVGLALLGVSGFYFIFKNIFGISINEVPGMLIGFGFGASLVSLFARIGGGIFTKAADVGADIVGKVEAGIPEDDPRNPAVIADNVGDNVGDCAGMGADLFETYAVTLIAAMILAASTIQTTEAVEYPMLLGIIAVLASIVGSFFVRLGKSHNIMGALYKGLLATGLLSAVGFLIVNMTYLKDLNLFFAALVGLVVTVLIVLITEYYTSTKYKPVKIIAEASQTGAGTNVIAGLAVGLESTWSPVLIIAAAILLSYYFGETSNFHNGLYGIAIASVAMLSTTGMIIATDSYGPITDNAGGIAEMSHQPESVREHTDALDAVGNTTKAVTKGYAIASAALGALVLFQAFHEELGKSLAEGQVLSLILTDRYVMIGLFLGGLLPFLFSSAAMSAVGKAAQAVVHEVRRQFREIKGIMDGSGKPDYAKCVDIVTKAALKEMIFPGLLAVLSPLLVGFILGPKSLAGLLAGVIVSGFLLALMMATGGGAWDNAKKYIEKGNFGGKGGDTHKAAVVGDTVGDPFKDTAGPAINALIKVISTIALIIAPLVAVHHLL